MCWGEATRIHTRRLAHISVPESMGSLLPLHSCLSRLRHHSLCAVMQLPVPPALLEISSLNRLMSIASRIVGRELSHESQEAAHARWKEWQSASNALGLQQQHLAVALSAQSKALMIFMHMAARYGSGRVAFKVSAH